MPISPTIASDLTAGIVEHYSEAERVLLGRVTKALAKGIDAPHWADAKLRDIHALQVNAQKYLSDLEKTSTSEVEAAVTTAWNRGTSAADSDMIGVVDRALNPVAVNTPGNRALAHLVSETSGRVIATHPRILRSTLDLYRSVVAQASGQVLLGTQTIRDAAQQALDSFAKQGITGFVDKAGRGWNLSSYVEMATRTATAHAAVASHVDRLQQMGQDLIIVSDAPMECSRCRPWEGKVLSISGAGGEHPSLSEATSAGLFHPGCRHSTGLYQPGFTQIPQDTEDPQGDADLQRLRELERQVRAAKRQREVALAEPARKAADRKVREVQAKIRDHVANSSVVRQPHREQLGRP